MTGDTVKITIFINISTTRGHLRVINRYRWTFLINDIRISTKLMKNFNFTFNFPSVCLESSVVVHADPLHFWRLFWYDSINWSLCHNLHWTPECSTNIHKLWAHVCCSMLQTDVWAHPSLCVSADARTAAWSHGACSLCCNSVGNVVIAHSWLLTATFIPL